MNNTEEKVKKVGFPFLFMGAGIVISILFIYLFSEVAEEMLEQEVKAFDDSIITFFRNISTHTLDQLMTFVTELGSLWFLSLMTIVTLFTLWIKKRDKWGMLFFLIGIGGGGLLTKVLKVYYARSRPSINPDIDAVGYSFPSGHSMGSLIFYGFIAYFIVRSDISKPLKWTVGVISGILIILIGTSRIYLDAHYPSDVIAGHLAGAIWLILCILSLEWIAWQNVSNARPLKVVRRFMEQRF
ncbi:phosphatase PAP2 family protein [Heyndrickxia sp. MSNUG]|uniref:phosphatase PAP2 family protein n=1 Tax=Heyndrickxia sp. MSNUG TaxID=3136677 RepID=UPI003C2C4569